MIHFWNFQLITSRWLDDLAFYEMAELDNLV